MRSVILLVLTSLCISGQGQTLLPKLQLLADSGIKEITLSKLYQGYYQNDKLLNLKDSGKRFIEYRYTFNSQGKITSKTHYSERGEATFSHHYTYNALGEPVSEVTNTHYSNTIDSTNTVRTEDNGFLKRRWHNGVLVQLKRYDSDSFLIDDRYYRGKDSFITVQTRYPGKYVVKYYNQGKVVRHVLNKWSLKEGQLSTYSEFEEYYDSKKGRMKTEKDVRFQVKSDSTLKLFGWYKDNIDYTTITYANWFTKIEIRAVQHENMFRLDEFIPQSRQMFQLVTFSGEGHRFIYEINYR